MRKSDVWMPLYIGDYLADTGRLTTEGHGAYLLLLMDYWRNGPPPDDDKTLAAITKLPLSRWRKLRPALAGFFTITDSQWRQKRADKELGKTAGVVQKRSCAGKVGAEARWGKRERQADDESDDKPDATAMANAIANAIAKPKQTDGPSQSQGSVPPSLTDVSSVGTAAPGAAAMPADDLLALPLFTRKPPDGDWKKLLFDAALPWLAQACGCKPDTLRPLFGRWLRDANDDAKRVYDAVAQAQAKQPADPRGWITAQLGGSNARRTDPRYRDHDQFRAELAAAAAEQLEAERAAAGGG